MGPQSPHLPRPAAFQVAGTPASLIQPQPQSLGQGRPQPGSRSSHGLLAFMEMEFARAHSVTIVCGPAASPLARPTPARKCRRAQHNGKCNITPCDPVVKLQVVLTFRTRAPPAWKPASTREAVPAHLSRHLLSLRAGRLRQVSCQLLRPSPPLRVLAQIRYGTRTSKGDGSRHAPRFLPRLSRRLRRSAGIRVPRAAPAPFEAACRLYVSAHTSLRSGAGLRSPLQSSQPSRASVPPSGRRHPLRAP